MLASIGVAQVGLVDPIDPLFRFVLRESCDQLARWTGQAGGRQVAGRSGWQSTSAPGSCHRPPSRRSSTGLSSLSRLCDLPIDEVKIDRSFIAGVGQDNARHRLVAGLLAFAERVGLTVVAEGFEREAERDTLTDLGCHRAQGFLFSKPVPAEAVDALLSSPGGWSRGISLPRDAPPLS